MAAITGAVIAGAATAYAANRQSAAGKDAARAQRDAAGLGIDEQRRQFNTFQENIQPYLGAGTGALPSLQALNSGNYSGFENSPDYLYARGQTQQGVERGAAARGGLYSGGTNVDLATALNGIASQNLGNYRGSLMGLAQMGQNSAVGAGSLGQQSANAISGLYGQQGNAAANGSINSANAWSNAAGGLASLAGQYMNSRQSSYSNPQTTGNFGAFAPSQSSGGYGSLSPSNGKNWNFGGPYNG